jgi:hypothetical protein
MKTLILVALTFAAACATSPVNTAPVPSAIRHRPGQLSRAELAAQPGRKLGEVIRSTDAGMLADRGEPLSVWIDGLPQSVSVLESLSTNDVQSVQRVSAADARQMFGDRANGAGIVVTTRHP